MRRCLESLWRFSEAKLDAVYAHSVHVKCGALWAYTDRTEAGSALAADGLSAEFMGPASTSSSSSCSACSRSSPSSSSFKRRRLPLRRSTRGGDGGVRLAACHVAPWSTSMGTAAVVAGACAAPTGSMIPALPGVQSSSRGQGPATADGSSPQGIGASHPTRSGSMVACLPSRSSQVRGT
uniref:Polyketide synthase n=1 Tax=Peronospora matthiolae TaxID=2874970 RepID=A0AAV1T7M2_9STRA